MLKIIIYILLFVLYVGGNYFVISHINKKFPVGSFLKIGIIILVLCGIASFFAYALFHDELPYKVSKFLFLTGTTWMNIFIYLFLITILSSIVLFINRFIPLFPRSALLHYTKENTLTLLLTLVFIAMLLAGGYLKYLWKKQVVIPIQLTKEIRTDSLHGDSIKILAVSDLHLGYSIGASELEEWVRQINNEHPDIVIIAGDIVDISTKPLFENALDQYFRKIKAPLGVYACLGNHEYYSGINKCVEFFKKANICLLRDSATLIDSTFYIVGRDEITNKKRKSIQQLTTGLDQSKPIILLDHQSTNIDEAKKEKIDLMFSGHTHNGQIWPGPLIEKWIFQHPYGYFKEGSTNGYVSSGIGVWGGKFRIGTQSEFVVFNIKGKK